VFDMWIKASEQKPEQLPGLDFSCCVAVWLACGSWERAFYHYGQGMWCADMDGMALPYVTHWVDLTEPATAEETN
jgi:hypothetical protein